MIKGADCKSAPALAYKKIETASTSRLKAMKTIKQCSENRKLETIISLKSRDFYPQAFYPLFC